MQGRAAGVYSNSPSRSLQPGSGRSPKSGSNAPMLVKSKTGVPSLAVVTASEADIFRGVGADVMYHCRECRVARSEHREHLRVRLDRPHRIVAVQWAALVQ